MGDALAAAVGQHETCDVAVIGGSLAGSAAGHALARAGARVLVVEKARFPRPKICGEFLSHEALAVLKRLDALDEVLAAGPETIGRFAIVRSDGTSVEAPLPAPVLSISRERLDAIVAGAAARAGVRFLFGQAVTSLEGGLAAGFRLTTPSAVIDARAVVGAWGRYNALDGRLDRSFHRKKAKLFGFKKHLTGDGSRFSGRAVLHLFDGGYLGLSLVEGGRVNLAALATPRVAQDAHHELDALLQKLAAASPALASDLEGLMPEPGPVLLSEPVHLGPHGAVAGDVLLVGDAAGVLDPYTGSGMAAALLTGEAAAGPLLLFLAGEGDARGLLRAHTATHRAVVGRRFLFSRLFRPVFAGGLASRLLVPAAGPLARWAARARVS